MKKLTFISIVFILSGCIKESSSSNQDESNITRFYELEDEYLSILHSYIGQLYDQSPDLVVVEYAIKRSATNIESDTEKYHIIKAIDRNSIRDIEDPFLKNAFEENGQVAKEIVVYNGVFEVPELYSTISMISVGSTTELSNVYDVLLQP
jgi:hypothetical protein